jgi:hypothetical protein
MTAFHADIALELFRLLIECADGSRHQLRATIATSEAQWTKNHH